MTPEEALEAALHEQSDIQEALNEGVEYWFPMSLAELARGTLAALPPGSALVTTETLAEALHETAPKNHNLGEGMPRAICGSTHSHLPRAAAIMEVLRRG